LLTSMLTPVEAWESLQSHNAHYYEIYAAAYGGDARLLRKTGRTKSFWKRNGKCRIHIPIAADIAAVSSDLLFSEEPHMRLYQGEKEVLEGPPRKRLDQITQKNGLHYKLNEGGETCAALGDVYLKLAWSKEELEMPTISIVQPDCAWAEYLLGTLVCIHFFTVYKIERQTRVYHRIYERYDRGKITMVAYRGDEYNIGADEGVNVLEQYGYESEIKAPINDMLAVHISNVRPNRLNRSSNLGRSDFDGLRDMMDSLDEAYSSWMRDIRLGKARLIVPAEYLRRDISTLFGESKFTYEFDEDVETLVAMDINTENLTNTITPSQFEIRSDEHKTTCLELIERIVTIAGYAPQSFGLNIQGTAQSGTALTIREKKSFSTRGKKQTYWQNPLEDIITALLRLDAALYPGNGIDQTASVTVSFADGMADDLTTVSTALDLLNRAEAISDETKVQMQHPDWNENQLKKEVGLIKAQYGRNIDEPNADLGDMEDESNEDGGEQ
jgi:A118 family predicted phage portal protein